MQKQPHPKPTPWFDLYINQNSEKKVIIIGGGISGAATAYSLAKRGYLVTLYEKHNDLALEASGNNQGILYGNFAGQFTPILELSLLGYAYSHELINNIMVEPDDFVNCGLIQLAYNEQQIRQQQQILGSNLVSHLCCSLNKNDMEKIAGVMVNCDSGLFYPKGLWVDPRKFVRALVKHPNITIKLNTEICTLTQLSEFAWQLDDNNGICDYAPNVVLCNSYALTKFTQLSSLHLRKIRGQISVVPCQNNLKTILCGNGYITPNKHESYTIGATFKFQDFDTTVKLAEHVENIGNLATVVPEITNTIDITKINGRVSFRSSTTDYVPLCGPIASYDKFKEAYQSLAKDSNYWINTPCPYLTGLYMNVAHGAKGLLTAPVCGEIIASYIDNDTSNMTPTLRNGLHPNRFWLKEIIKKYKSIMIFI